MILIYPVAQLSSSEILFSDRVFLQLPLRFVVPHTLSSGFQSHVALGFAFRNSVCSQTLLIKQWVWRLLLVPCFQLMEAKLLFAPCNHVYDS